RVKQIHLDRFSIEGRGDFALLGSGTLDAPVLNAQIHLRDLALDHEPWGGFDLEASTKGTELQVSGHSSLSQGSLDLNGKVGMRGVYPASFSVRMDRIDLDSLWRSYLRGDLTGHSAVGGELAMQGPLRDPRKWTLNGNLSDLALEIEKVKIHNQDPIRFTY